MVGSMQGRITELLGLVGRALLFLLIDLVLGIAGVVRAVQGAHTSAYVLGMLAAFLLVGIFLWVAYRALAERDVRVAGPEASSATHVHAHPGSVVNVYNTPESPPEGESS